MKLKKEHLENKLAELLFLLPSLQGVKCVLGHFSVIFPTVPIPLLSTNTELQCIFLDLIVLIILLRKQHIEMICYIEIFRRN